MSVPLSLPAYRGSTVGVSALFVGNVSIPTSLIVQKPMPGHDTLDWPLYSFLIENEKAGKKVLFDLGLMKAWKEKQPDVLAGAQKVNATFEVLADVSELLTSASVPLASIDSIIWSHHHVEHIGDPSLFPPTTSLIVGPGFKTNPTTYPGFPTNPDAHVSETAFQGRDLLELDFTTSSALKIGGLRALDWFGDGSLYLLEAPGHTPEHIMALARTSADKFVLLAGDAAEHAAVLRPSPLRPLPDTLSSSRTTPFYEPTQFTMPDAAAGRATLAALQAFDASARVFVVLAHEPLFRDSGALFPAASLARWEEAHGEGNDSRKDAVHWRFLADFQKGAEERRGAAV
ncbi:beta-lactamase-like protein [Lactarius pseudohatsudake]|nr:beta-lactamase-like protein [Lactarius pseudohatsudake]